jgi:hypothetical protein
MRRLISTLAIAVLGALWLPVAAQAEFGLNSFDLTFTEADGSLATQAGSHPFAMTTSLGVNFSGEGKDAFPEGRLKDAIFEQIAGFVANTTAYETCSTVDFMTHPENAPNNCPLDTVVGATGISTNESGAWFGSPVYNLTPPPGVLVRLGFPVFAVDVVVDAGVKREAPFSAVARLSNTSEALYVFGSKFQLWGDPSDPLHNDMRGGCYFQNEILTPGEEFEFESSSGKTCPVAKRTKPFLTLPTRCTGQNRTSFAVDSWEEPGSFLASGEPNLSDPRWHTGGAEIEDEEGNLEQFSGCDNLNFTPSISARPTSKAAQSPTGLDFSLDMDTNEGLESTEVLAQSEVKKVVVTLPEGMTANPSVAEGLEVCSQADLARETVNSAPGEGCPEASKIGTVEVESPLVSEAIRGALYQATPYENEFGSLIAFYLVLKNPNLGVIVKQGARVEPDPHTGQLIATTEGVPQLPFSHFKLHFREGGRSPLVSPPGCGSYQAKAEITPWSGGSTVESTSSFQVISGPDESACPSGGTPPFQPGFEAGSVNNAAGAYSPFSMRLTRRDGDQDLTRFDATLPPGVVAKLAGVAMCSDAQIALAKAKTGRAELQSPSCPAGSKIGRVMAGAGVGSQLTYVPGSVYLAGPFGGAPLSVVAVVPAVAGPFDIGTVVTRQALVINPRTGEVRADGAHSDPIPHILAGIPLTVRDIQVYIDRNEFTLNPTSCDPFSTSASIWGGGANPFSVADDSPVGRTSAYQAANCSRLGFKPQLSLKLVGGTKRGDNPKLKGLFKPRVGDANLEGLVLRFPRSAFLDQSHIHTICTRVQFAAKACPAGSVYGHARAVTPILSEPLEGPVYLRSSNHNLPDFVAALHGLVDVEAVARIDSKKGGIRATFTEVPDAPISKVEVNMQGGKKGLIVNSTDLCLGKHRANAQLSGHNGKELELKPAMQASCGAAAKHAKRGRR